MFSWDRMVLSKISNFIRIVEDGLWDLLLHLPYVFLERDFFEMIPFIQLLLMRIFVAGGPKMSMEFTKFGF